MDRRLSDLLAIVVSASAAAFVSSFLSAGSPVDQNAYFVVAAFVAVVFLLIASRRGVDSRDKSRLGRSWTRNLLFDWTATFLCLLAVAFGLKAGTAISRTFVLTFFVVGALSLIAGRALAALLIRRAEAAGLLRRRPVCLIGEHALARDHAVRRSLVRAGYAIVDTHTWDDSGDKLAQARTVINAAISAIRGSMVEEIIIATDVKTWLPLQNVLRCQPLPVRLVVEPEIAGLLARPVVRHRNMTLAEVQRGPLSIIERRAKRVFDVACASSALFFLLPLLTLVAIALKLDSPGPVLFRQTRHGFNGQQFRILKFRTMRVQEDGAIVRQATRRDPRVTFVGRFLRRTSIDELPQLVNILRGEMSFVGPRPHAAAHDTHYEKLISNYASRHHVKPGLTGWAQVRGARGETRDVSDMAERVRYDIWYIDNFSLLLDARIVLMTFRALFVSPNAY